MSRIDELIQQLCPDGVEYKPLGDIVNILDSQRKPISKEKRIPGKIPYYGANGIQGYVKDFIFDGIFLLIGEDGSVINKDGSPVLNWAEGKIWVNNHAHILTEKKDIASLRFIFFFLQTYDVTPVVRGTPPKMTQQSLREIMIPVPPLPVQEEIVRILDKFTALEAELEAELEARRKQYEFYRDQLLTFGDEVEWKPLGEVCGDIENIRWTEVKNQVFCYIDLSSVDRDFHKITTVSEITNETAPSRAQQIVQINDILLGTTRPLLKRFCIIPEKYNGQICSTGYCVLRPVQTVVLPLWIYYQISLQRFYDYIEKYQKGASYPAISDSDVKRYKIPVPPLAEQERIVAILDKFDALVNDISSGLPAELEMRRKQYEYYRDRLLTFKPLAKEA